MDSTERIFIYVLIAAVAIYLIANWNKLFGSSATSTTSATSTSSSTSTAKTVQGLQVIAPSGATVYSLSNNVFSPVVPAQTVAYGTLLFFTNTAQRNLKSTNNTLAVTYYNTSQGWVASTDVQLVNILKNS